MPGGTHDSSRTRVAPVFDRLRARSDDWVRTLVQLVDRVDGPPADLAYLDLRFIKGHWGPSECGLEPPVSLLSWLIRNPTAELLAQTRSQERSSLARGDPETVLRALKALRSPPHSTRWHLLEGRTFPDVLIETPDAMVVAEGKRTEVGPTLDTTWLTGRHQIWRHIDATWEIRGRRRVLGFFIVQGQEPDGAVPASWQRAVCDARSTASLDSSFPHRSSAERDAIAGCLLGVTTWEIVCEALGIPRSALPPTIADLPKSDAVT